MRPYAVIRVMHTALVPHIPGSGASLVVTGEEAKHAIRVKRLEVGYALRFATGAGEVAVATISDIRKRAGEWELEATITQAQRVEKSTPRLHVFASAPKGERLESMIDGLAQVGAAGWSPLLTRRTVVEPSEHKRHRLERVALEALKQCGSAYVLEIGEPVELRDALRHVPVVLADASGDAWSPHMGAGADQLSLLIGPEGGWTPEELETARAAGAVIAKFGRHTMRTEVAAVVAAGIVLHA